MSKNVAVFVDVANIFYAAKAAGVDIDYVTLLKAATAGRDFVRAYAYTGLDPENENQRQFHAFLGRNGYKVISKDIRKYGDGRIKANLDIELVVDMMKTARNLDIAVVVSGDGDFAPAIRAVQEMGVRCEVISFRGNTSSDLIEVADLFTDIAQIARVDKSGRSGRRVAAEGDLSMTEVPEKETEGIPRRRRGRGGRDERPQVVEAEEKAANLVVLPGERLSRAPEADGEVEIIEIVEIGDDAAIAAAAASDGEVIGEDGRRRRRRRGGRGRGRGHRPEEEGLVAAGEPASFSEEDEQFEELPVTQAPVHTFGSVWDSQLGVPSAGMPPTVDLGGAEATEDDDYAEPEVPEYLLAERRQSGQRPSGRGRPVGRGRGAYQQALDRERYGRNAPQQPTFTGGGNRPPDRNRDRGRQGRPQQSGRPVDRGPRIQDRQMVEQRSTSSEPWSEVPPELEQMLRAELARKQPAQTYGEVSVVEVTVPTAADQPVSEATAAKPKRTTRSRTTTAAPAAAAEAPTPFEASPAVEARSEATPKAKPKAAPRTRTTTAATKAKAPAKAAPAVEASAAATPEATPKATPKAKPKAAPRTRTTKSATPAEEG